MCRSKELGGRRCPSHTPGARQASRAHKKNSGFNGPVTKQQHAASIVTDAHAYRDSTPGGKPPQIVEMKPGVHVSFDVINSSKTTIAYGRDHADGPSRVEYEKYPNGDLGEGWVSSEAYTDKDGHLHREDGLPAEIEYDDLGGLARQVYATHGQKTRVVHYDTETTLTPNGEIKNTSHAKYEYNRTEDGSMVCTTYCDDGTTATGKAPKKNRASAARGKKQDDGSMAYASEGQVYTVHPDGSTVLEQHDKKGRPRQRHTVNADGTEKMEYLRPATGLPRTGKQPGMIETDTFGGRQATYYDKDGDPTWTVRGGIGEKPMSLGDIARAVKQEPKPLVTTSTRPPYERISSVRVSHSRGADAVAEYRGEGSPPSLAEQRDSGVYDGTIDGSKIMESNGSSSVQRTIQRAQKSVDHSANNIQRARNEGYVTGLQCAYGAHLVNSDTKEVPLDRRKPGTPEHDAVSALAASDTRYSAAAHAAQVKEWSEGGKPFRSEMRMVGGITHRYDTESIHSEHVSASAGGYAVSFDEQLHNGDTSITISGDDGAGPTQTFSSWGKPEGDSGMSWVEARKLVGQVQASTNDPRIRAFIDKTLGSITR